MKLIDKDALVAEIEKRKNFNKTLNAYSRLDECNAILSFIDTLEVKEVDLEKEITDYLEDLIAENTKSYFRQVMLHFFELGLKAQKGE